ncbi:flavin reductase family protein [Gordonia sp. AC31]|uniref:flavin reductase family protein n=1 Tax=Gordonia sp. AC31 TaxID=2962571 RepID=UPI00288104E3|nr:flavin reductase family protein [Gordonia sp. AC31]MDT0222931.1 flavin reductase family protein [Gordonia sp. AC31]
MSLTAVDLSSTFRDAMAHMCAPVSVITTMDGDRPHGTTVSAVMSLSVDPLLIAVALAETSESLRHIRGATAFGVNVLDAAQENIALRFATKGDDKFDTIDWTLATGVPRITGTAVWVACTLAEVVQGGDHALLFGSVVDVERDSEAAPLTYHGRRFGTHVPLAEVRS